MSGENARTAPIRGLALPPERSDNLVLSAPIASWEDAIPLGNGLFGALVWGENNTVRLSLDRGDMWDERTHGEEHWWRKHPWASLDPANPDPWGSYYMGQTPTKLPSGRLEISLAPDTVLESLELDLAAAQAVIALRGGAQAQALVSATSPVAVVRFRNVGVEALTLLPAGTQHDNAAAFSNTHSGGAVAALGYPAPQYGISGDQQWFLQHGIDGYAYCTAVALRRRGQETLVAVTVTTSEDCAGGQDLVSLALERCRSALDAGYDALLAPHVAWWNDFWSQSSISLPDPALQRAYQFTRYLYGAGSRKGAPPMPLQGVWTADNGGLPPWKGDYHNDLNTQLSYGAYHHAGQFDAGESYLDFLWQLLPDFKDFARDFYGTGGLASPGVMSLRGQPLGGWSQYSMSPTMSAWNAHLFYLHWRYTDDGEFLATRAYPWAAGVGQCLEELLCVNDDGVLVLPLSSSPEIFDNKAEAWLVPNSNYDLMCMKMLFLALEEMASALHLGADSLKWASLAAALGDFHTADDGELLLDALTPLQESHRHLSNLMAIHPFNLITVDGGAENERIIRATLAAWDSLGTAAWTGYSWSWMAGLRARVGDGEEAFRHLEIFTRAFTARNGFHLNGDQSGEGHSAFTYRPFTLEGNFAAMEATGGMLLQSWSPTPGRLGTEVIRIFPAVPWHWHEAGFTGLRTEGGHRVSARRENNATTWFKIVAGSAGTLRIRDNFGGQEPDFSHPGVRRVGVNFEVHLASGEDLSATLERPGGYPEAPESAARSLAHG